MFYPGSSVRLSVHFRDLLNHTDFEPSTVRVRIKKVPVTGETAPAEVIKIYGTDDEVVRDKLGHYHINFTPLSAGLWMHRWEGGGEEPVASEAKFKVQETSFTLSP